MKPFVALKASAGSGKTFALTVRYISLLLLNAKPNEILTLTFTNKAASQMNQRIYDTLLQLGEDEAILGAIQKQTNLSQKAILEKKPQLIKNYLESELSIYTIDKFVNKILREFSGYVGISDDFSIEFDDEELLLYKFLLSLDQEQFSKLIRFANLENKRFGSIVELFKILRQKDELIEFLENFHNSYDYEALQLIKNNIMTHAIKIKKFIDQSEVSASGYKAVDFQDVETLLEKGKTWLTKDSLGEFTYFKKAKPPKELDDDLHELQKFIGVYYQVQESITLENLFKIFEDYQNFRTKYNKKRNSLEFGDITSIVYELIEKHIQKDFIYFRLDTKYNHILIDEFQDTSTIQFEILHKLIEEIVSGDPETFKTFFYVGDIKQSIYRFRGGKKELFDHVAKLFYPMLEVELLDTNYRSAQNVVSFVNTVFEKLPNYEYDHQKAFSNTQGFVQVVQSENDTIYETLCQKVQELLEAGVDANNIAILTYTNGDVLDLYEYLKLKIPKLDIVTEMTSKLINQRNVKAVIQGIKYLYFLKENPKKDQSQIYKANFNTLRGKHFSEPLDFEIDIFNNTLLQIVKSFCEYYKLIDNNVLRFFQVLKGYETIVDFVYNIEKDDTPIVSQSKKGLSILTIFKSKGLEFDTVLVLDRISQKNSDKSSLLFDYDGVRLQNIFYKRKSRENFDPYYAQALEREKSLNLADELNILYVALTRAKNNMIVLKKEKQSVFEYLGDFDETQMGALFIQKFEKKPEKNRQTVTYAPMDLGYQQKQKSPHEEDTLLARYFGIATHFCLEMMKQFDQKSLQFSLALTQNKFSNILDHLVFKDIEQRIQNLLSNKEFQKIHHGWQYTKEQSIIFNGEHKIIDLLLQKGDQYAIVDYKTTTQKLSSHISQVKGYTNAIKNITKSDHVKGYIVYLDACSTEIVQV